MKVPRTRNQDRILNLLQGLSQPISAQSLYIELRNRHQTIGLATVYRALEALKLSGLVQVRTLANGESLYSSQQEDRHHLTCLQCGTSLPIGQCPVQELEHHLNHQHQFKIYYHMLEFFGVCQACQVQEPIEVS